MAIENLLAESVSGKMDFVVRFVMRPVDDASDVLERLHQGTIFWDYPDIRIETNVTSDPNAKPVQVSNSYVYLETPDEFCTLDRRRKIVYRNKDKSFDYDKPLKLAPWQHWVELASEVRLEDMLDLTGSYASRFPTIAVDARGSTLVYTAPSGAGQELEFDSSDYLLREFRSFGSDLQFEGEFEWVNVNGRLFPSRFQKLSHSTRLSYPAVPDTATFSNWHPESGLSPKDYRFASLPLDDIHKVMLTRLGQEPVVKWLVSKQEIENQRIEEWAETLRKFGFAKER